MKELIADILVDEFYTIYCDSCANKGNDECDDCHRKNMKWRLSRNEAFRIAEEIIEQYTMILLDKK